MRSTLLVATVALVVVVAAVCVSGAAIAIEVADESGDIGTDSIDESVPRTIGSICGGFLAGIVNVAGPTTNCSFVVLDNETDKTKVMNAVDVCQDHRQHRRRHHPKRRAEAAAAAATGFSSFSNPTKSILFVTGDGDSVHTVATSGGAQTVVASLPSNYAQVVGLVVASGLSGQSGMGGWYVVTRNQLLSIDTTSKTTPVVMDLSDLSITNAARVVAHNITLYILDATQLHSIDLTTYTLISSVPLKDASLATALTVQYWITNSTLVTVRDREVIQIDPVSGMSYSMMSLPPGHGAINRATNFGDMYFVTDDDLMYLMNLGVKILETTAPWPGASTVGSIEYYY